MNLVVVGAQWGDEGKGKIVDYLAQDARLIVRFSGGANAGHTIVTSDGTYKLHLVPSGVIYPGKEVLLGTGMVIDLEALFSELATLTDQGVNWEGRVFVSERAHLVIHSYKEEDQQLDRSRFNPIGTTGRGIGIAYAHKSMRDGIRSVDIYDDEIWAKIPSSYKSSITPYRDMLRPLIVDPIEFMERRKGSKVLLEGAQGVLLDTDWGTYPYVSSGYSSAGGACLGGGIGPRGVDRVLGVFKAYSTRVGNGPFPSEFDKEQDGILENHIREIGREYGVTTGRPRRCGYLDLVALKYACKVNGLDALVLTHIDVYDTIDEVSACISYEIGDEQATSFPASIGKLNKARPVLKKFKGWKKSLKECKRYEDLPSEARSYIEFIEDYCDTPIEIISVGFLRSETFIRKSPWRSR